MMYYLIVTTDRGSESVRRGTDILAMLAALCAKWMRLIAVAPKVALADSGNLGLYSGAPSGHL